MRHRPLGPPCSWTPAWRPGPAGCPRSARGPVSGRLTTDRDVACRFQDSAGPPHVGPMRDRPGSPRGQVRRRSRVRRCRRTPRRTRPLRLRRPKRRSSETHPSALACSDIYLVSEILSELHDFRSAPEIHPALRERGGSVGRKEHGDSPTESGRMNVETVTGPGREYAARAAGRRRPCSRPDRRKPPAGGFQFIRQAMWQQYWNGYGTTVYSDHRVARSPRSTGPAQWSWVDQAAW